MSFSSDFDQIQKARDEDDPALPRGEWVTDLKVADWGFVIEKCSAMLRDKSKDLRLGAWLAEALAKTQGFAGLAQGYALLSRLIDRYWKELHPLPHSGDHSQRVGNISWLLARSVSLVKNTPLTHAPDERYCANDFQAALALQEANHRDPGNAERLAGHTLTIAKFVSARDKSGREFYAALLRDTIECSNALAEFEQSVHRRLGIESPSFVKARDTLADVQVLVERFARETGAYGKENSVERPPDIAGGLDVVAPGPPSEGKLRNRSEALQQLRQVADYFRRTEPHSPVAYLADKAARWGEMPLDAWLRSVVKDEGVLSHIEEILGVERSPDSEKS
jgi:type VI secretion system protein ImpA